MAAGSAIGLTHADCVELLHDSTMAECLANHRIILTRTRGTDLLYDGFYISKRPQSRMKARLCATDLLATCHSPLVTYLKFSTSIRSQPDSSSCVYRIERPSGETDSPLAGGADIRATMFTFPVAKLRNWMEELRLLPGHGM